MIPASLNVSKMSINIEKRGGFLNLLYNYLL